MRKLIILTVFILLMSFGTAMAADKTYLVVMSSTNTGNNVFTYVYHEVDSMVLCYEVIEKSRVDIPMSGDAEASIAMFCTTNKGKVLSNKEMTK